MHRRSSGHGEPATRVRLGALVSLPLLVLTSGLAAGSADCVGPLLAAGLEAFRQGDLAKAEGAYRQALGCRPGAAEDVQTAAALNGLGQVESTRGDLVASARDLEHARAIWERLEPAGLGLARTLHNLALLASMRGDEEAALGHARRSLELVAAAAMHVLGDLEGDRGEYERAEEHHLKAFAIEEKLAPESFRLAV